VETPVGEENLLRFLGLHVHDDGLLVLPIDVSFVHRNRLADPHAGRIEDFEQGPRAEAGRNREVYALLESASSSSSVRYSTFFCETVGIFDVLPAERDLDGRIPSGTAGASGA
jgi:hypothetical protein